MRAGLSLILVLLCPALAAAQPGEGELPSEAMLEFLADVEPLDEETWQLLEHHALQDETQNRKVTSE